MVADMKIFGLDHSYSALFPKIGDNNPDDSFSTVPYEKGFQFLNYLENITTPEFMQDFLKYYIEKNTLSSIGWEVLRADWEDFVKKSKDLTDDQKNDAENVDWETWVFVPGLPPF